MSRTVDDKVVAMSFENHKFESGVRSTISSIDKLKAALHFGNAGKGLAGLSAAANRTDLSHISRGVDEIKGKFGALRIAAIAAMASIAARAANVGVNLVKSFTVTPVLDGLHEYENQLNAVQTILGNTKDAGTNLQDVNKALAQLNKYADQTIYNFGQMTKNVGTFTAAGVDLKTSVASIKGISNLAALSGSSAEQASTAMYQLSQAISAGRVGLQDWNSVVNAGMGGAVFQKSLLRTAENMGALKDGAVEIDKATGKATVNGQSFRESIMAKPGEKSWLTGDVLTNTLKQLSGDMTDAQLKAEGFSDAQIKAIQAQSKMALDAATKVKTLSQLLDTTKEAIGSGWATTFQILLGDFGEAKHLFTGLSTAIGGFVKTSANARNSVLKHWKNLGGRTLLISSLKQAFKDLVAVVTPIREAFRDIFPKKTARDLLASTKNFQRLTETLKPSAETVENLRRTFRGLFAAFDIGKQIIGGIFTALGHMLGAAGDGAGNILSLTGNVGDLIVKLDDWLSQGDKIHTFFAGLGDILSIPIHLIGTLTDKLNGLFSGGGDVAGGLTSSLGGMAEALKPGTKAINAANGAWNTFLETLNKIKNALKPVVDEIVNTFSELGDAIASGLEDGGFEKVFQVIQTGLIAGIFLTIKKGLAGGVNVDLGGGALKNVSKSLNVLKGSLVDIQKNIQAHTLLLIASAVAVLTVSVVALSLIKPDKLAKAMTAISVGMGQLVAALAILNKAVGTGGFARLPFVAASLILLAASIDVLAVAVTIFSKLSWEDLAKGLVGVGGALLIVTAGAQGLSRVGPQMALASVGLIAMGVALTILGGAVKIFSTMSWGDMIKGLAGVVLVLDGVALASRGISPQLLLIGPGIIALGIGLNILAGAVKIFGSMDMATLGKGLGAVAVALIAIGAATWLLPPHLPLTAAGLILVGIALTGIAGAVALMGNMDMSTLAKGIGGIAAALAVLAIGLTAMIASLPGAAALIVAAGALAILVPVIGALGKMKLSTIARGLGAVVVTMIAIALAGAVAAPGLIALGAALAILGVGLALTAGSVYILAKALVLLGDKGGKGIALMIASLTALVAILPKVIIQFVKGMVEVLAQVALIAPKVVDSVVKIIESLLEVVIRASPRMAKAAIALISAILKVFAAKAPAIIEAGWKLLLAFLKGIDNHITEVTKRGIDIALKFLKALAGKIPAIVTAGANILAALLKGIAKNIGKVVVAAGDIIIKLAGGLVKNLGRLVTAGVSILGKIISTITNNLGKILTLGTTIVVRLVKGIGNAAGRIATAAIGAATHFVNVMAREIPKHVDQMATAVIKMINRMAAVVRKREPEFIKAVGNLGIAIVEGIVAGMGGLGEAILKKIKDEITSLPGKGAKLIKKALSKVSVALPLPDGLVRKFGVTLTLMTAGFAGEFEDNFQKALVKIGGATNIETLHNLGNDLSTSFMDGLLSGIDRAAIDPIQQAGSDIVKQVQSNQADIENAILESNQKIRSANAALDRDYEARQNARSIKDKQSRKDKLASIEEDIKQQKAIRTEAGKTLAANEQLLTVLSQLSQFILFDPSYQQQIDKLAAAKAEVIRLNDELEKQTGILDDLKSKRQSLFDQTFEKFSAMPGLVTEDADGNPIDADTQVQNYIASLSNADDQVGVFTNTLDTLQGMGLNQETYQQLLDIGPAAQGFADALVKLGPDAIAGINAADSDLRNAAAVLAQHGADEMYKTGIDTAQGLVDGLKVQIPAAVKTAEDLARAIVKAIKKRLRIKSPSRVLMEIGELTTEGLGIGLESGIPDAVSAMNKVVAAVADAASQNIDTNPTITPVLDLSNIQNGSKTLSSMFGTIPIAAAASLQQANAISEGQVTAQQIKDAISAVAPIQFTQNNTSPKALSSIEIYRQTKNQLAQARPVLAT